MPDPTIQARTQTAAGDQRPGSDGPDPTAIAIESWQAIEVALQPILGRRGVEALYWRSLQLAAAGHPWLAEHVAAGAEAMDLEALAAAMAGQPAVSAEAASRATLHQFRQLLVSLVGASLTARLMASVPAMSADTPTPQDMPK